MTVTISRQPSAMQLLRGYRVPRSVQEALLYLYSLSEPLTVLRLYRHYFPGEFARSTASSVRDSVAEWGTYSPMEQEFLMLINEHMFPISDWMIGMGRALYVPIQSQGLEWWDTELDTFREGWQFLLVMSGIMFDEGYGRGDLSDKSWEMLKALQPYPQVGPWSAMQMLCPRMPEPLCHLQIAMSIIDHSTGNPWFDSDSDAPIDVTWCEEDIDELTEMWREASPMWDKAEALVQWLETSEENRAKCIAFWRVCLEKPLDIEQADFMLPLMGQAEETQNDASRDLAGGDGNGNGDGNGSDAGDAIRARRTPISTLHREMGLRRRRRRRTFIAGADALIRRVSGGAR